MNRFIIEKTKIDGLNILTTKPISDHRGFFQRVFCQQEFAEIGLDKNIVNVNNSLTKKAGSIRGLHYQTQPFAEIKIVKCIKGSILDVAVDIRKDSPTFLQYVAVELTDQNNKMLYIPEGFAHGFQSLTDNAEIVYFVTNYYSKEHDSGLNPLDPKISIRWAMDCTDISDKDKSSSFIDNSFIGI